MNDQSELKSYSLAASFKECLYQARRAKGWSQSELARQMWGSVEDSRGYTVAKNRDRISAYERGRATPERETLDLLVKVFDVTIEELAPDLVLRRAESTGEASGVHMTLVDGSMSVARLEVNVTVSLETASKVIALLGSEMSGKVSG
ncbi:helix-turn-helix domain-containing protein [Sinisalibacter aestuarii]|uniref:HTH cro/C1-type domain-containing protein n=1 Tax=Sinisalibacter aestuarii TaxID=2949426 RepID=A0ABQ5LWA5_9RHOB|nr:helix-turn-helix transcriptional regulator [Sinisalibacter aestuarii]GKY89262.1 hypothetical protein STA1M1_31310 [Sinisalibacter aestuarii]